MNLVVFLLRDVGDAGAAGDRGVVDQNRNRPEGPEHLLHGGHAGVSLRDVACEPDMLRPDLACGFLGAGAVDVEHGNTGAVGGEEIGGGPADAGHGCGAGYHHGTAIQKPARKPALPPLIRHPLLLFPRQKFFSN